MPFSEAFRYYSNRNITTRGSQTLTFNPENRMETAAGETYTYDEDGVRMKKVARTIADMAGAKAIGVMHLAEALQYRPRR